jgi:predicted RNA-binding Zn ribbon-like protein
MDDTPRFVAGNLALDFHNTASWKADKAFDDNILQTYAHVVGWAAQAGAIDGTGARVLLASAEANQARASDAIANIQELRDVMHRVFDQIENGESPAADDLEAFNEWLITLPMRLRPDGDAHAWDWSANPADLLSAVWPVVWSAANLLQSDDLARVGVCEADGCGWLFIDRSRRHNRKWCQMEVCGNRAKAKRHYHRKRQG